MTDAPEKPMICATCTGPLDYIQDWDGTGGRYCHGREEFGKRTHVVVPVDVDEIAEISDRCDFCFAEGQHPWTVVAQPFITKTIIGDTSHLSNYSSLWCACQACGDLIKRRRWSQLTSRVLRESPSFVRTYGAQRTIMKQSLAALYDLLEVNFVTIRASDRTDYTEQIHAPDPRNVS